MGLKRDVGLFTALRYKGQAPMLTYVLHRLGGLGLFIFFTTYLLALAGVSAINALYENWLFHIIILFLAIFHAINGLRITILDLWPGLIHYYRSAIAVEWVVFAVVYGFAFFVVLRNAFGGA